MNFKELLNNIYNKLECTQIDLSTASGLSASVISRYLSGEREPAVNSEQLISLAKGIETIAGEIVVNPKNPQMLGLRNTSNYTWKINLPDGSQKPLAPGSVVPMKNGFVIDFFGNNQSTATMKI